MTDGAVFFLGCCFIIGCFALAFGMDKAARTLKGISVYVGYQDERDDHTAQMGEKPRPKAIPEEERVQVDDRV